MTPATVNLSFVRGDDFSSHFQFLTCDQANPTATPDVIVYEHLVLGAATFTPLDMTGGTVASQIRRTVGTSESLLCTFTVTYDDPFSGLFTLSLPHVTTAAIKANDSATQAYDVQFTDSAGKVTTYIMGAVEIITDVTR